MRHGIRRAIEDGDPDPRPTVDHALAELLDYAERYGPIDWPTLHLRVERTTMHNVLVVEAEVHTTEELPDTDS